MGAESPYLLELKATFDIGPESPYLPDLKATFGPGDRMVHVLNGFLTLLGGGGGFKWCMFWVGFDIFGEVVSEWSMYLSGVKSHLLGPGYRMVHVFARGLKATFGTWGQNGVCI